MFDYCGDTIARLDDFRDLLTKVVQETFPTGKFDVRVRHTKAMAAPKSSILIVDGPLCADFAAAIPLLAEVEIGTRWAYCGKVLPDLGWRVRWNAKSTIAKYSTEVWSQMKQDDPIMRTGKSEWKFPSRSRPVSFAKHQRLLSEYLLKIHPAMPSPTMALIARGLLENIVQMAMDQRRDDLARSTPLASGANIAPSQRRSARL